MNLSVNIHLVDVMSRCLLCVVKSFWQYGNDSKIFDSELNGDQKVGQPCGGPRRNFVLS